MCPILCFLLLSSMINKKSFMTFFKKSSGCLFGQRSIRNTCSLAESKTNFHQKFLHLFYRSHIESVLSFSFVCLYNSWTVKTSRLLKVSVVSVVSAVWMVLCEWMKPECESLVHMNVWWWYFYRAAPESASGTDKVFPLLEKRSVSWRWRHQAWCRVRAARDSRVSTSTLRGPG